MAPSVGSPEVDEPRTPSMRFKGGDVVIHISNNPSESLLLHSEFLAAKVDFFKASAKKEWATGHAITDPETSEEHNVSTYALVAKDGTYWLEQDAEYSAREVDEYGEQVDSKLFVLSEWCPYQIWDSDRGLYDDWTKAAGLDMKAFFVLLYGLPLTMESFVDESYEAVPNSCNIDETVAIRIADILATAQYFMVEDDIRPKLVELLMSGEQTWKSVYWRPRLYADLANLIACEELLFDAVRNYLAEGKNVIGHCAEELGSMMGISEEEAVVVMQEHEKARGQALESLRQSLQSLALAEVHNTKWTGTLVTWRTTFMNAIQHRLRKGSKNKQRAEFLARAIWSQHVIQHFDPIAVIVVRKKRGREAGQSKPKNVPELDDYLETILKAAESEDPCAMFGIRVLEGYVELFGGDRVDIEEVRANLAAIVKQAAEVIKKWGEGWESSTESCKAAKCGLLMYGTITWARVPLKREGDVDGAAPDNFDAGEPSKGSSGMLNKTSASKHHEEPPKVSMEDADAAWLEFLGILGAPEEEDHEQEETDEAVHQDSEWASAW